MIPQAECLTEGIIDLNRIYFFRGLCAEAAVHTVEESQCQLNLLRVNVHRRAIRGVYPGAVPRESSTRLEEWLGAGQ